MRRGAHRLILIGVVAFTNSVIAAPRECPTPTLEDDFNKSAAVFVGRAIAQSVTKTPQGSTTETTFEIERVWKGQLQKAVRIQTCGGSIGDVSFNCSESFTFGEGSRYVVFASGEPLTTN